MTRMHRLLLGWSIGFALAGCAGSYSVPGALADPPDTDAGAAPADTTAPGSDQTGQGPDLHAASPDLHPAAPDKGTKPQSTLCTSPTNVQFTLGQALQACQKNSVTVRASAPFTWVLAGISSAGSSTISWFAGATNVSCSASWVCNWTFGLTVPCAAGPYTLHFMVEASNNNPASGGLLVASCTP